MIFTIPLVVLIILAIRYFMFDVFTELGRVKYDSEIILHTETNISTTNENIWVKKWFHHINNSGVPDDQCGKLLMKNSIHVIAHLHENITDRNLIMSEANDKYKSLSRRHKKVAKKKFITEVKYTRFDKFTNKNHVISTLLEFKVKDDYVYLEEISEQVVNRSSKLKKIK